MDTEQLPLLELFIQLQDAGLPLGIDDYRAMLHALQSGFGVKDRAALKRLCHILWVRSPDEGRLLDYHFEQMIPQQVDTKINPPAVKKVSRQIINLPVSSSFTPDKVTVSEMTIQMDDEIQVAQAVQASSHSYERLSTRYIPFDEYFPVTRRQMKQSWRYLRRPARDGAPVELDVEATVNEIGRAGIFLEPVLVPARINRAEILLLFDHSGSMVPFHILSNRLMETVQRGGRMGKVNIYYFHNCPKEYLYRDPAHWEAESIKEILNRRYSQGTGILVFSDAGAARGGFNQKRADLTEAFLKQFKGRFRYIAWLNPMPRSRWFGTTAENIMHHVPMFDLSRQGLDSAISVLRGRPARTGYESLRYSHHE